MAVRFGCGAKSGERERDRREGEEEGSASRLAVQDKGPPHNQASRWDLGHGRRSARNLEVDPLQVVGGVENNNNNNSSRTPVTHRSSQRPWCRRLPRSSRPLVSGRPGSPIRGGILSRGTSGLGRSGSAARLSAQLSSPHFTHPPLASQLDSWKVWGTSINGNIAHSGLQCILNSVYSTCTVIANAPQQGPIKS